MLLALLGSATTGQGLSKPVFKPISTASKAQQKRVKTPKGDDEMQLCRRNLSKLSVGPKPNTAKQATLVRLVRLYWKFEIPLFPVFMGDLSLKDQGNAEFRSGNYLKAAALYSKAIKEDPDNCVLYRCVTKRSF
jgi:hypothetical protein